MSGAQSPIYDARSSTTSLTPYLTLPHLLSLTWLAYPILSLIFVAFRLQLSLADVQNAINSTKSDLIASCKAAETAATSAASMPRFLALATNQQYADAVNGTLNGARATLILALTVMEAIINFLIDIYRSTFLCFLELIVQSGIAVLIGAVQAINDVLQTVASSIRSSIQSDISGVNSLINSINKVNPLGDIPQITVPDLSGLQNVTLPASFQQALTNLNNSIPSVADIKNQVEGLIDTPFELVKQDINATFANISLTPDGLPVPELNTISFCGQLDTSVIDDIGHDLIKLVKIGIVIIVLIALFLVGLNCLLTWYKWRCMKNHLEYTRQAWSTDPTMVHVKAPLSPQITLSDHNLIMLQANSEHPLITRIMNTLSSRFNLTPTQHIHTQWFLHYVSYRPALACLLIGVFGILSVQIQLWALGPLVAKYQDRAAAATTDFSTTIANSINDSMYNQSSVYANDINGRIDIIQNTVNDGLFGWVTGTTTTLNTTLNNFYTDVQSVVTTVFGNTILAAPANAFLACFIGSKVDALENALTFLHDNLNIDIPRVNQSVLVLSPASVNEAAQPIALAALGGNTTSTDDGGLVGRLVDSYAASLRKERIMFAVFIALWGLVVLMGLAVVFWHAHGKRIVEQRGRRRWEREQRAGGAGGAAVFLERARSSGSADASEKAEQKLRSFSPLPSPRRSTFTPFWASRANSPDAPDAAKEDNLADTKEARPWELAHAVPALSVPRKTQGAKLLAIGRRAMGRGERLKKDGSEEELQQQLTPVPAPAQMEETKRGTAWFGKVSTLLGRKDAQKSADAEYWDPTSMQEDACQRPQLYVRTQGPSSPPEYQPETQDYLTNSGMRSRFSVTPDATKTSYLSIMSPTKKTPIPPTPTVVVSAPTIFTPTFTAFPYPARSGSVPTDVGSSYPDDPFSAAPARGSELPIPLYASFDTAGVQYGAPPRHPQLQTAFGAGRRQDEQTLRPPVALAPPPAGRHRRSVSSETGAQWRVTNAAPGESRSSSIAEEEGAPVLTPVTQMLTTTHARQSSLVNPFITPFDDEHQVQIDYPTGMGARKSMATNPFAHAI